MSAIQATEHLPTIITTVSCAYKHASTLHELCLIICWLLLLSLGEVVIVVVVVVGGLSVLHSVYQVGGDVAHIVLLFVLMWGQIT